MSLTVGSRLGPYEIIGSAVAGGMGEVYRARDTRLDRTVAIKTLPSLLAASVAARQRFEREAKAISSLSHAHICQLYDIGHDADFDYLVLEYLEGETLQHRLERGPLPIEQVVKLGAQLADALEKAHGKGIIHRDLKPANIMLTKSGAKLLDFGVAKAAVSGISEVATAITESRPLTVEGTIIGTFQYMAPEQVEGNEADARSDIFSLGAVLYEATTGKRAFEGRTQATVIAAVLERDPLPITSLQPLTPPVLGEVIKTCLRKDPDERFQTAHDLKLQLQWIAVGLTDTGTHAQAMPVRKPSAFRRERLLWAAVVVILIAALASALLMRSPNKVPPKHGEAMRFEITAPKNMVFTLEGIGAGDTALSPDGKKLVFSAVSGSNSTLWVRSIDSLDSTQLPGTDGAKYPFWSPDSEAIGFFVANRLKRVPIKGGDPETIATVANPMGGAWNNHGVMLVGSQNDVIYKVSDTGGTPEKLTQLDSAKQQTTHRFPQFLPDGKHFIFECGAGGFNELNAICTGSIDSSESKPLLHASSNVDYADGYLFYYHEGALHAHPFDPNKLTLTGPPVHVVERVQYDRNVGRGVFSVSPDLLIYEPAVGRDSATTLSVVTDWKALLADAKPDND